MDKKLKIEKIISLLKEVIDGEFRKPFSTIKDPLDSIIDELNILTPKLKNDKVRIENIIEHITHCFSGNFFDPFPISELNDELDVISAGINTYMEELNAIMVSKEELEIKNKELLDANQNIKKLSKAKDEFMSNISHELRTPLNGILANIDLLNENNKFNDVSQKQVDDIKTSGDTLLSLINKILESSKDDFILTLPTNLFSNSNEIKKKKSEYKVLIVEDNMINQLLLKTILEKEDYKIDLANDGLIGLEKVKENSYDVILMDLMMPEMNGFDATKEIRSLNIKSSQTPIIAVTADVSKGVQEKCKAIGMNDYLSKPIDKSLLLKTIARYT